ncbi:MAG: flagellar hook-associated protein FlgK, partial [Hyphomicrobiaceae bacterium]
RFPEDAMTLSSGLDIARSSLSVNSDRASVVARNIASADDPGASRKIVNQVTVGGGGVRIASISREIDAGLFNLVQSSTSDNARNAALVEKLDALQQVIGSPEDQSSPAATMARLRDDLLRAAGNPDDLGLNSVALATARDVVRKLNDATDTVQRVRAEADQDISKGVERLNTLLNEFDKVNVEIVNGTRQSRDVTDHEDARDRILTEMSGFIDIRTVTRADNDMVIMTGGSLVLYEGSPRTVSFNPTTTFTAATTGSQVYVDGMPVTGGTSTQAAQAGSLVGLARIRDDLAVTTQTQLDEMARGLVTQFAESDQTGGGAPTQPGLFTYAGGPAMPPAGIAIAGIAGTIAVSASVDPVQGGDVRLLRDGAISDPGNAAYVYNTEGASGYSERLLGLADAFDQSIAFDGAAVLSASTSLISFSVESTGWLQEQRRNASNDLTQSAAVMERASISLSKATGVNLDEEMTLMLDIERSYQASARLMSSIDAMIDALFAATR